MLLVNHHKKSILGCSESTILSNPNRQHLLRGKGMKTKLLILMLFVLTATVANAEIVTIALEAVITMVDDSGNLLEGAINVDDVITGIYTYNTDTVGIYTSDATSDWGAYYHTETPYGLSLTFDNGMACGTDPGNIDFEIKIIDGHEGIMTDNYYLHSFNNLPLDNSIAVDHITWHLSEDETGGAIDSTALTATAPVLEDWTSSVLTIKGDRTPTQLIIESTVYSVEVIPEPATILLLAIGGGFIRRYRN